MMSWLWYWGAMGLGTMALHRRYRALHLLIHAALYRPAKGGELVDGIYRARDGVVAFALVVGGQLAYHFPLANLGYHLGKLADGNDGIGVGHVVGLPALSLQEDVEQGTGAVYHIAPRPVLCPRALHHDVLATLDVADELCVDAVVGWCEKGSEGVAGTGDHHVGAIFCGVGDAQGLGGPLGRWVARPGVEWVDIAAVVFGEHPAVALAIYLARGYIEHAFHAVAQSILHGVGYPDDIGLDHLDGRLGKEIGTGIAGGENDVVESEVALQLVGDIVTDEMEVGGRPVSGEPLHGPLLVAARCVDVVVDSRARHENVDQASSYQAGGSRYQDVLARELRPGECLHGGSLYVGGVGLHLQGRSGWFLMIISASLLWSCASAP